MSEKPEWPRFEPEVAPFFEAAADGRLRVKHCSACGKAHYYPRAHCPLCFSDKTEWRESAGEGTVHTYTVLRGRDSAKVIAYVELDEGVRMLTNILDCEPDAVAIGKRAKVTFREQPDGTSIPFFTIQQD